MDYIIRKLFLNPRLTSGLCNSKYGSGTRRIKRYFHVLYGVKEEHMEMQEETVPFKLTCPCSLGAS